ncbi:MAG: cyclodeaminase/cyclohydrolase family protein [Oscillospiraceae bacterium]|nr:cyclodeaminase/cyclohydrolase family protein [Oscillospiraceae bacterium]
MADLIENSCAGFAAALASDAPVPGGGGAAALAGALAAALGAMAARLSVRRKKTEEERAALGEDIQSADGLRLRLLTLIDRDAAGFEPLSRAYSLPKEDPERGEKLRAASLAACEAPMEMLRCCGQTAELLTALRERVSPLLLSDVGCAAALCRGALESAAMNVWVNTRSSKEDPEARALNAETRRILDRALPLTEGVTAAVRERLET